MEVGTFPRYVFAKAGMVPHKNYSKLRNALTSISVRDLLSDLAVHLTPTKRSNNTRLRHVLCTSTLYILHTWIHHIYTDIRRECMYLHLSTADVIASVNQKEGEKLRGEN